MLVLTNPEEFSIRVSNRIVEGIAVGQVVRITETRIRHCACLLRLAVHQHALNPDDTLGAELPQSFIRTRTDIVLVADNNTLVDAAGETPGRLRYQRITEATALDYLTMEQVPLPAGESPLAAFGEAHEEVLALQGDLFEHMKQQPQVVAEMQRHHILAADALARFA